MGNLLLLLIFKKKLGVTEENSIASKHFLVKTYVTPFRCVVGQTSSGAHGRPHPAAGNRYFQGQSQAAWVLSNWRN